MQDPATGGRSLTAIRQRLLDQGEDPTNGIGYDQIKITLAHAKASAAR